jgi:hypothetical protein
MSATNFTELRAEVLEQLSGRTDITTTLLNKFIASAEQGLYEKLRVRFMETDASVAITLSVRTSALPTRWKQGRSIRIAGATTIFPEYVDPKVYWSLHADRATATPDVYTITGENFIWGPLPSASLTATATYYQRPASLSADADTNGLFTLAPDLLKFGALIHAYSFIGDMTKMALVAAQYQALLSDVNAADRSDRYSGDTLTPETEAQRT